MVMTLAECNQQEQFDKDVYESNKSLFETLFLKTVSMPDSEERRKNINVLLASYNNMADSCRRQVQVRRRLENGHS